MMQATEEEAFDRRQRGVDRQNRMKAGIDADQEVWPRQPYNDLTDKRGINDE